MVSITISVPEEIREIIIHEISHIWHHYLSKIFKQNKKSISRPVAQFFSFLSHSKSKAQPSNYDLYYFLYCK